MRISYSALETFKQCPLKFKFQYIEKISTPKSKAALFGTLIHKTLKVLHEPGLIVPTQEELLQFFNNNWDSSIYTDEREASMVFAQGVKILKDYYAKNYPADFNVLALETPFEVPIKHGEQIHLITGKIDRIDKTPDDLFEVIDYKTSKKMPSQEAVNKDLQLSVYHLGVVNRWPSVVQEKRPIKVSLYFLKHGEKLSSIRSIENLEETKENILVDIEKIEALKKADKFEPKPGPLCDWCDFQRRCPYFKHKFVEEKLFFNDRDIKSLLNEYLQLEEEIKHKDNRQKAIKDNLTKFMDQEKFERLFSEDGCLNRQIVQYFKYNPELLKQILEPLDQWQNILKIDDVKLKKLVRNLPTEIRNKIEQARELERETKKITIKSKIKKASR